MFVEAARLWVPSWPCLPLFSRCGTRRAISLLSPLIGQLQQETPPAKVSRPHSSSTEGRLRNDQRERCAASGHGDDCVTAGTLAHRAKADEDEAANKHDSRPCSVVPLALPVSLPVKLHKNLSPCANRTRRGEWHEERSKGGQTSCSAIPRYFAGGASVLTYSSHNSSTLLPVSCFHTSPE